MLPLRSTPAASYLFQTKVSRSLQLKVSRSLQLKPAPPTNLFSETYWGVTLPTMLPPVVLLSASNTINSRVRVEQ